MTAMCSRSSICAWAALQAELLAHRQQLNVLRGSAPRRPCPTPARSSDLPMVYRLVPSVLDALSIVRPETISDGIAPVFERFGAGNHEHESEGHVFRRTFDGSSVRSALPSRSGALLAFTASF